MLLEITLIGASRGNHHETHWGTNKGVKGGKGLLVVEEDR